MRKAKTPPKRKSVRAGRRAAKPKAAKGKRAKIATAGNRAQAARKSAKPAALQSAKAVKRNRQSETNGKNAAAVRKPAKTPKSETQTAPKGAQPAAKATASKAVAPRASHEERAKDSKKALPAERVADRAAGVAGSGGRHDGAAPGTSVGDKTGEAAVLPSLPTPIASFTI